MELDSYKQWSESEFVNACSIEIERVFRQEVSKKSAMSLSYHLRTGAQDCLIRGEKWDGEGIVEMILGTVDQSRFFVFSDRMLKRSGMPFVVEKEEILNVTWR